MSAIRVGATTGIANRALARKNAKVVGIFGSGNEARTNLEAICAVRDIEAVKVYSPNKEHRDRFAEEMTELLNVEVQPVTSAEAVVKGSDIVMCATNSSEPVFDGNWLEPGQLVTTIANTDGVHRRTEADATTMLRSGFHRAEQQGDGDYQPAARTSRSHRSRVNSAGTKSAELGQVLIGKHPGRTRRWTNHLLQEQHRCRHSIRRHRRADLRSLQETRSGARAAKRMVRRGFDRVDG